MWSTRFKAALVRKDVEALASLVETMPQFETAEAMQEAAYLLAAAHQLLSELQNDNRQMRSHLKKNIDYLKSTQSQQNTKIDFSF